jgi:NhaP-type Na+/H+ or K+/H+ antiporter
LHTYGFLAVFTAAVALQWSAQHQARGKLDAPATVTTTADTEVMAPIRRFNSDLESFVEFALVVLLGVLWASLQIRPAVAVVALLLFAIIRPIAVYVALAGTSMHRHQRALAAWFGIRGIGSLYYVFYALNQGWRTETASEVLGIVAGVVICSIVVHGVSVTPLMSAYARRRGARGLRRPSR